MHWYHSLQLLVDYIKIIKNRPYLSFLRQIFNLETLNTFDSLIPVRIIFYITFACDAIKAAFIACLAGPHFCLKIIPPGVYGPLLIIVSTFDLRKDLKKILIEFCNSITIKRFNFWNPAWSYFCKRYFRLFHKEQFAIQVFCYPMRNRPIRDHWTHYKSFRLNQNSLCPGIYFCNFIISLIITIIIQTQVSRW